MKDEKKEAFYDADFVRWTEGLKKADEEAKELTTIFESEEVAKKHALKATKRRPTWHELFMSIAKLVAERSKDPHTKVGAVLVKDNRILGIGYNAEPKGFSYPFDWHSEEKYDYVIHAEMNAIANASIIGADMKGASIYVTLSPCPDCMKLLIQYEVENVFYLKEYEKSFEKTKLMAKHSKVNLIKMEDC